MTITDHNDILNSKDWRSFLSGYWQKDRINDDSKGKVLFREYLYEDNLTDEQKEFIGWVKSLDEGQGVWVKFELIDL